MFGVFSRFLKFHFEIAWITQECSLKRGSQISISSPSSSNLKPVFPFIRLHQHLFVWRSVYSCVSLFIAAARALFTLVSVYPLKQNQTEVRQTHQDNRITNSLSHGTWFEVKQCVGTAYRYFPLNLKVLWNSYPQCDICILLLPSNKTSPHKRCDINRHYWCPVIPHDCETTELQYKLNNQPTNQPTTQGYCHQPWGTSSSVRALTSSRATLTPSFCLRDVLREHVSNSRPDDNLVLKIITTNKNSHHSLRNTSSRFTTVRNLTLPFLYCCFGARRSDHLHSAGGSVGRYCGL